MSFVVELTLCPSIGRGVMRHGAGAHYKLRAGPASVGEMLSYMDARRADGNPEDQPLYAFDAEVLQGRFRDEYPLPPAITAAFKGWPVQVRALDRLLDVCTPCDRRRRH